MVNFVRNIHDTVRKSNKADLIQNCCIALEKTVKSIPDNQFLVDQIRILPVLVDLLHTINVDSRPSVLTLIENVTFGAEINEMDSRIESLVRYVIEIIHSDKEELDLKVLAVSILINVVSKNKAGLTFLKLDVDVDIVKLQKKIDPQDYGILSFHLNLVLHDCGHSLVEADIENFLKMAIKILTTIM